MEGLPPRNFFMDAIDKATVENYQARANARGVIALWEYNKIREKANAILEEYNIDVAPILVIEWGGGYSHYYHCYIIFQDASALVIYTVENKISFIRINKDNEVIKKYIKHISSIAKMLAYHNGNLGSSGQDKEYCFITYYFRDPWSNYDIYNSFAFEYSIFRRNNWIGQTTDYLYSAYKKQLENEKITPNKSELADEVKNAFGFIIKQ